MITGFSFREAGKSSRGAAAALTAAKTAGYAGVAAAVGAVDFCTQVRSNSWPAHLQTRSINCDCTGLARRTESRRGRSSLRACILYPSSPDNDAMAGRSELSQVVHEAATANGYAVREAARHEYDGQFFIGFHVLLA